MRILKQMIKKFYTRRLLSCGKNIRFNPFTSYLEYRNIVIGDNVFINKNAYIAGRVVIGDNVLIGPNVTIIDGSGNHNFTNVGQPINVQGRGTDVTINIGKDSWVAANVIIIKGAGIGEGSIIGAGSLVTKEMPPYCICFGAPCKPESFRYTDEELKEHFVLLNRTQVEAEEIIQKRQHMFKIFFPMNI
jgi:acetyltransferase-like isoleucine patch superfamily enzyme